MTGTGADPEVVAIRGDVRYERVVFFSDAVFAIAATLLFIDLRVPEVADPAAFDAALRASFGSISPFVAVAIGFAVVGSYWMSHRAIFALIARTNGLVIWANLHFLFWVAIQPYFTAALAEHATTTTVVAYAGCQVLAGLAQLGLWAAARRDPALLITSVSPRKVRYVTVQLLRAPVAFAVSIPVAFVIGPVAGMVTWGLIVAFATAIHVAFRDLQRWTADHPMPEAQRAARED